MINVPLLRKVVEWAEEQANLSPEDRIWRQQVWILTDSELMTDADPYCGTTMCIAGKVALDAGWYPDFGAIGGNDETHYASHVIKDGQRRSVELVASDELGLTKDEALTLFYATNTADQIRDIATEIVAERHDEIL